MLSASVWNTNLLTQFGLISFTGDSLPDLTDALSKGFTDHIVGKSFSTTDTGVIGTLSTGKGTGTSLVVSASVISANILSALQDKGFAGTQLTPMCQAIGNACSTTLLTALLTSTHTLITGTGTVVASSIGVTASGMSSQIQSSTTILTGDKFADFCDGVSEGFVKAIKEATGIGTVTITPLLITDTPIPPPTTGTGTGLIS